MKLQIKIVIAVFLPTLILGLGLFTYFQENMISSAQEADGQIANQTIKQIQIILSSELFHLGNIADDWAVWTDTYNFVETNNTDYVKTNLGDSTFQQLSINLMLFVDSSNRLVYGKAYDLQNHLEIPLPAELQRYLSPDSLLLKQTIANKGNMGVVLLDQKPMLVVANQILTSDRQGPSHGTLIVGRFMDSNFLAAITDMTGTQLIATSVQGNQSVLGMQPTSPLEIKNQTVYVRSFNSTALSAQMLLSDINGNPAVVLETISEQIMTIQAKNDLFFAFLAIIIVVVASAILTVILIAKFVLSRITVLSEKMSKIEKSGITDERVEVRGNDEISDLSKEFNVLLDKTAQQDRENKSKTEEISKIVDGVGDLLFVIDKNRVITKVNKATCDTYKKKPEEIIGKHCYELVHGTKMPWCNCPAEETFKTKQTATEEVNDPNLGKTLLVTTSPILDEQGEVAQVIHIAKDITTIKLAEMELHISANLFDAASDSILVHDLSGRLIYFNEAAYKTRGYTRDEFQGLSMQDLEVLDNPRFTGAQMTQLLDKGEATYETVNLRKDKTLLPVEIHARVIDSEDIKLILSVARDISERKATEEKLKESQKKYEITFESSTDALMLVDEKSFLDCNTATLRLFGFTSVEEFTKNHPSDLSPTLQPDGSSSLESAVNLIKKALLTGKESFFWVHKRTDGTLFPAEVLLSRIPLKNQNVLQATVRDITERKEAEEKLKESSRRIELMVEKLRVVGSLTRHDVRNKLSAVTGYAYLLKKKHADQADIVEGLGKMEQAVKETVRIFDFAKMYEQLGVEELTYINVEAKINEATSLFSGSLPKIINECHGLTVLADSFLRQLFYNFIDNTRKYGQKTTTIKIHYEKADQDSLKLVYEDDGVGVSLENKTYLFKEGFTTGGSTGFGLFLTKKMMDVYGWQIQENGTPGEGAKFNISIPKLNKHGKENYRITQ